MKFQNRQNNKLLKCFMDTEIMLLAALNEVSSSVFKSLRCISLTMPKCHGPERIFAFFLCTITVLKFYQTKIIYCVALSDLYLTVQFFVHKCKILIPFYYKQNASILCISLPILVKGTEGKVR